MKKILILFLLASPAAWADKAIVATDQEITALIQLIDEAVKAKGLSVAPNAVYWVNKLQAAPVVTEQKEEPPK